LLHWTVNLPIAEHYFTFVMIATVPLAACACLYPKRRVVAAILVLLIAATNILAYKYAPISSREELREAVKWIDRRAKSDSLVVAIAFYVADAYSVYGKRGLTAVGLPSGLPGRAPLFREQEGTVTASDRESFEQLIQGRKEVFLMASDAKRGQTDRGLGLVNTWLNESGFTLRGLMSWQGVAVSRFVRAEAK
jgi:hypothetical protein